MSLEISEFMNRAQELQERIAALSVQSQSSATKRAVQTVTMPTTPGTSSFAPVPFVRTQQPARLFDVALAEAGGNVSLRPLGANGSRVGKFTPQVDALIEKYAAANGLDTNLVRGVVEQESSGNPQCVSRTGAKGLMQLMPETARSLGVSDPFDPEQNIAGGTKYLAGLMQEFGGNTSLALAAYNAGSGAVKRSGGIPPYTETQDYVRKIMGKLGVGR